ncbi:MAG: NTP transferase domain-containing protein [Woeseiaceae bacterium]|nr:NTP transferase domain-containing protein [Woeseiaceae bacterium]
MINRPIYGLILSGGKSRRMGTDKALINRGGQSQLAFIMGVIAECVDRSFVSSRSDQVGDSERSQFEQIIDRYNGIGPVAGILSAFDEHPDVDWLIVACDLPNITTKTVQHLLAHRDGEQLFTAYMSSFDSLPEPLCAVYHSSCIDVVRKFVDDGVNCPRKILIRSATRLLEQPDPRALDNINTPHELQDSVLRAS